jgi:transposase
VTVFAYRFALAPTPRQERALRSHAGAARVAFNWGPAQVRANLAQREAERSYGIAGEDLTPSLSWSLYSLRKDWNAVKDTVAPWWAECSKEAFNTGLDQLARALKNLGRLPEGQKAKLALSERTYCCEACGTILDRDVNAAVNLARLPASGADSNGRGAGHKTTPRPQVAAKRQPGETAPAVCETGTVSTQEGTAA